MTDMRSQSPVDPVLSKLLDESGAQDVHIKVGWFKGRKFEISNIGEYSLNELLQKVEHSSLSTEKKAEIYKRLSFLNKQATAQVQAGGAWLQSRVQSLHDKGGMPAERIKFSILERYADVYSPLPLEFKQMTEALSTITDPQKLRVIDDIMTRCFSRVQDGSSQAPVNLLNYLKEMDLMKLLSLKTAADDDKNLSAFDVVIRLSRESVDKIDATRELLAKLPEGSDSKRAILDTISTVDIKKIPLLGKLLENKLLDQKTTRSICSLVSVSSEKTLKNLTEKGKEEQRELLETAIRTFSPGSHISAEFLEVMLATPRGERDTLATNMRALFENAPDEIRRPTFMPETEQQRSSFHMRLAAAAALFNNINSGGWVNAFALKSLLFSMLQKGDLNSVMNDTRFFMNLVSTLDVLLQKAERKEIDIIAIDTIVYCVLSAPNPNERARREESVLEFLNQPRALDPHRIVETLTAYIRDGKLPRPKRL